MSLYKKKYKITRKLTKTTDKIWITNHSNVEATLDDIIEKTRQIKEEGVQDRKVTTYNAVACSIGILETLIVISSLVYRASWLSNTTNFLYKGFCHKKVTKTQISRLSTENINPDDEVPTHPPTHE